ncbi:MAG: FtsW/RodA/SpoVE family cell cycle protein [Verrucomicrobiales bacterium]
MSHRSAQILVVTVLLLVALGLTMLCSTNAFGVHASADDIYYEVKRQFIWILAGGVGCVVLAILDYHWWQRTAWLWYGVAIVALVLCFVPHVGMNINGESRWVSAKLLGLSSLRFQPSELGKLAMLFVIAAWYDRDHVDEHSFLKGFLVPIGIVSVLVLLILGEVDMGSAAIIAAAAFAVMFLAGADWKYLTATGLLALGGLAGMVMAIPNRLERVTAIFDPNAPTNGVLLQQYLAKIAFGSGGVEGLGLGSGRLKMLYMPFAHTDFIFPMIGEELGLFFTLAVVLCFVIIVVCGMLIALHAPDRFGRLLGFGIVSCIAFQAILNIGVTTSVLPNTGLPLPFVSYGGSNIIFCLTGVGILLNIFRQGTQKEEENYPRILRTKLTPRV